MITIMKLLWNIYTILYTCIYSMFLLNKFNSVCYSITFFALFLINQILGRFFFNFVSHKINDLKLKNNNTKS